MDYDQTHAAPRLLHLRLACLISHPVYVVFLTQSLNFIDLHSLPKKVTFGLPYMGRGFHLFDLDTEASQTYTEERVSHSFRITFIII